ncbi:MAG TPA: SagB/ThcOx family dehydrogenase [Terriglobia bacterium]|nr:SagB/ThcOx family dehydrogenase [Terriglobia bacterium]
MKNIRISLPLLIASLFLPALLVAQELKPLELPKPQMSGGMPLMEALKARRSTRTFKPDPLPAPVLSNLLWAAFGINRPESGKRTAPSAMNWQENDIYVFLAGGVYVYDAKAHRLNPLLAGDFRASTGTQDFVKDAPLNLVYVADLAKTGNASPDDRNLYTAVDAGLIVQNVYLFCASEGLATVVRGSVDRPALAKILKLRPDQRIIVAQTVGDPGN